MQHKNKSHQRIKAPLKAKVAKKLHLKHFIFPNTPERIAAAFVMGALVVGVFFQAYIPKKIETDLLKGSAQELQTPKTPFLENIGQINKIVKYYTSIDSGNFFIDQKGGLTYALSLTKLDQKNQDKTKGYAFREKFLTSNKIHPVASEPTETKLQVSSTDKNKTTRDIPTFFKVSLGDVYKNISVELNSDGKAVEKIFTVKPGGLVPDIKLTFEGIDKLEVNKDGELVLVTKVGEATFSKPIAFQMVNGKKKLVSVKYQIFNKTEYGFEVGEYNRNLPLIIDPVLNGTFLGGSGFDRINDMKMDYAGNIYVTGFTFSSDFPATVGTFDSSTDIYVSKFTSDLATLSVSHIFGADGGFFGESGEAMVIDSTNDIFITGYTNSSDFFGAASIGGLDGFVLRMDQDLDIDLNNDTVTDAVVRFGGTSQDFPMDIILDGSENVYVTGDTQSSGFPTTTGDAYHGSRDAFVIKFPNDLSSTTASRLIGTTSADTGYGLTFGNSAIYVTGDTANYTTFGDNAPDYLAPGTLGGGSDAFVMKLTTDLATESKLAIIGGEGQDVGYEVRVNSSGNAVVAAKSASTFGTNWPVTGGAYQGFNASSGLGGFDVTVAVFDTNLTSLLYSTFYGGTGGDETSALAIEPTTDNIVIKGATSGSTAVPTAAGSTYTFTSGGQFVAKFDPTLATLITTNFIDGSSTEGQAGQKGLVVVSDANIYTSGQTASTESGSPAFPVTLGSYDATHNSPGDDDGFIINFNPIGVPGAPTLNSATPVDSQVNLTWTAPLDNGGSAITKYYVRYGVSATCSVDDILDFNHVNCTTVDVGLVTNYSVVSLTNGVNYRFAVFAKNSAVGQSLGSSPLTATPAPVQISHKGNTTVTATPTTGLEADGVDASLVTVTLRDAANDVIPNHTVNLDQTANVPGGAISNVIVVECSDGITPTFTVFATSDVNGQACFRAATGPASSTGVPGSYEFQATDLNDTINFDDAADLKTVTFDAILMDADTSTIAALPTSVEVSSGGNLSTITVTILNRNNIAIPAHDVVLTSLPSINANIADVNCGSGTTGITNSSGQQCYTVFSTVATTNVFTATDTSEVTDNASVTFTAGEADATTSTFTPATQDVTGDGVDTGTLIATIKDEFGNGVSGTTVNASLLSGSVPVDIVPTSGVSNGSGIVNFVVNSDGTYGGAMPSTDIFQAEIETAGGSGYVQTVPSNDYQGTMGTLIGGSQNDDGSSNVLNLPISFSFYGTPITTVTTCPNGQLFLNPAFGNVGCSTFDPIPGSSGAKVQAFNNDLVTTGNPSQGVYYTTGTAGSVDYIRFSWITQTYSGGTPVDFDVILYENNAIEFHYGNTNSITSYYTGIDSGDSINYILTSSFSSIADPAYRYAAPSGTVALADEPEIDFIEAVAPPTDFPIEIHVESIDDNGPGDEISSGVSNGSNADAGANDINSFGTALDTFPLDKTTLPPGKARGYDFTGATPSETDLGASDFEDMTGATVLSVAGGSPEMTADEISAVIPMTFTTTAFGQSNQYIQVCSDGFVLLKPTNTANSGAECTFTNTDLSSVILGNNAAMLAGTWHGLSPDTGVATATIKYKIIPNAVGTRSMMVVEFNDIPNVDSGLAGVNTFQIKILEDGAVCVAGAAGEACGTQTITCPTLVSEAYSFTTNGITASEPANFTFSPIQAVNTYETVARQNDTPVGADSFNIHSNFSAACTTSPAVSLAVAADDAFKAGSVYLSNTGLVGGNKALLSLFATPAATCATNGVCEVLSSGSYTPTDYSGSAGHAYNSSGVAQGTPTNYLIDAAGATASKTLFTVNQPFTGDIQVTGINYFIAVPANPPEGSFTTTLTYTLS